MPQSISQSSVISADTVWGRACASTRAQSYETIVGTVSLASSQKLSVLAPAQRENYH